MRLPCAKGERFLPADRVTTGWSKLGRFGYALACFIFRFLRRPQQELAAWFSARQAAKADSQSKYRVSTGGSLLEGLAEAVQVNSSELTEAQAAAIWQGLEKVAKALRKAKKPKPKRTST